MYTVWAMYAPLFILFGFGLWSFWRGNARGLLVFDVILVIFILVLIAFGGGMFLSPTGWFLGFIAFFFVYWFLWLLYGTRMEYKNLMNTPEDTEVRDTEPDTPAHATADV